MSAFWGHLVISLAFPGLLTVFYRRFLRDDDLPFGLRLMVMSVFYCIAAAAGRQYADLISGVVNAVAGLLIWLWTRRRKDRAPRLLGGRAEAILAAMVAVLRERATPRPIFRPVPAPG